MIKKDTDYYTKIYMKAMSCFLPFPIFSPRKNFKHLIEMATKEKER